jgi:hypothetical protein
MLTKVGLALDVYNCTHDKIGVTVLDTNKQIPGVTFRWPGVYKACVALDGVNYVEQPGPSIIVTSSFVLF